MPPVRTAIGRAMVSGACPAKVDISETNHGFAGNSRGDHEALGNITSDAVYLGRRGRILTRRNKSLFKFRVAD